MVKRKKKKGKLAGRDLPPLLERVSHYVSKKAFVVQVDLDTACEPYSIAAVNQAQQRGMEEISQRLQPLRERFQRLEDSLYESGVLFHDPTRGIGINTGMELTVDQRKLYQELDSILDGIDTHVNI